MLRAKHILIVVFLICIVDACKKENDRPQWDVGVLGPVVKGTLSISNLINDTLLKTNPDNTISLIYEKSLYSLAIDSIVKIPDTIVTTVVPDPLYFFPVTLFPGFPLYNNTDQTRLSVNNVQLRYAIVKSGKLQFKVINHLHTKVFFTYTIPGATSNNVALSITTSVEAATAGRLTDTTIEKDLSGYDVDLTGSDGKQVNAISYALQATTDPSGASVTLPADSVAIEVDNGFVGVIPYYVKGYLGQTTINIGPDSTLLDLFKSIKSGTLDLESATMKLTIENDIGMDAVLNVNSITAFNSHSNSSVSLNAPTLINKPLNINRALASGTNANPSYIPAFYSVQISDTNSNFKSLLDNLPDYLNYKLTLQTNPLGNVSGDNDFAFADSLVNATISLNVPLNFSTNQLTFSDTSDFSISGDTTLNNLGAGQFFFNVDNGFPFAVNVTLVTIDSLNHYLDMLLSNAVAAAPPLDATYKVIGKQHSQFIIPVDDARIARLRQAKRMVVTAAFTSAAYPQHIEFYSNYSLDFKLIADLIYHVR